MEVIKKQTNSLKPSASHSAIYEEEDYDEDDQEPSSDKKVIVIS